MANYKEFLSYFYFRFRALPLTIAEIDGKTKYFTSHGLLYGQKKYETKPRVVAAYYSRYLHDKLMYKEFDIATYIKNQLRSTSIQIVKDFECKIVIQEIKN
jgi:hypothetical protein